MDQLARIEVGPFMSPIVAMIELPNMAFIEEYALFVIGFSLIVLFGITFYVLSCVIIKLVRMCLSGGRAEEYIHPMMYDYTNTEINEENDDTLEEEVEGEEYSEDEPVEEYEKDEEAEKDEEEDVDEEEELENENHSF